MLCFSKAEEAVLMKVHAASQTFELVLNNVEHA